MRIVAHFDMDAFFAAIEERDKPRLEGLPVVVGADPMDGRGRGVVSTANYKAREYGIHSAMPISEAWRLSEIARRKGEPETVFIGVNMGKYAEESEKIMEIIRTHVALVEQASVDEAYADLTPSTLFRVNPESAEGLSFVAGDHSLIRANRRMVDDRYEKARELCKKIKKEVKEKRKLTVSVGVGPNKLIAKIASGMNKPDGLTIVREEEAEAFLEPMHIRKIPGIGPKTEEMFLKLGVKLVRDMKKFSKEEMEKMMGKWGLDLYEKVRGRDDSPVVEEYEAKSIGEEETFSEDTKDARFISERLNELCESVIDRLADRSLISARGGQARLPASGGNRRIGELRGFRTVAIKVRFADFETKTRAHTLAKPASDLGTLKFEALRLLAPFLDKRENPRNKKIRLIGVRIEKLI